MLVLAQCLKKKNLLTEGGTIFEDTDGCAKQYRCTTAIHLLSVFYARKNGCIDKAIGAPGHDKGLLDGINACYKQYLKQ